jgi:hypothetical protein
MGELSTSEQESLIFARITVSAISLVGSLFIITLYALFRELRGFTFKLIFFLSLSDAIYSAGYLIPAEGAS